MADAGGLWVLNASGSPGHEFMSRNGCGFCLSGGLAVGGESDARLVKGDFGAAFVQTPQCLPGPAGGLSPTRTKLGAKHLASSQLRGE